MCKLGLSLCELSLPEASLSVLQSKRHSAMNQNIFPDPLIVLSHQCNNSYGKLSSKLFYLGGRYNIDTQSSLYFPLETHSEHLDFLLNKQ